MYTNENTQFEMPTDMIYRSLTGPFDVIEKRKEYCRDYLSQRWSQANNN